VVDEHRTHAFEPADDMVVVDDLVPDVNRRPVCLEQAFDNLNCPIHSGAEAPRCSKKNPTHGATSWPPR
jgi:hypothetical protein